MDLWAHGWLSVRAAGELGYVNGARGCTVISTKDINRKLQIHSKWLETLELINSWNTGTWQGIWRRSSERSNGSLLSKSASNCPSNIGE